MRDIGNLTSPDEPFGASHRPLGARPRMAAAIDLRWRTSGGRSTPLTVAVAYARVNRAETVTVVPGAFPFGFRCVLSECEEDTPALVEAADRILVTCRRLAILLAARALERDLIALGALSGGRPHPGITSLAREWPRRSDRVRGLALMVDTVEDLGDRHGRAADAAQHDDGDAVALEGLRCAFGTLLAAGVAHGYFLQPHRLDVGALIEAAAWDQLPSLGGSASAEPRRWAAARSMARSA